MDHTPEQRAQARPVVDERTFDPQHDNDMLRLLDVACRYAWRRERTAGRVGVAVGALVVVAVGPVLVSQGRWLGFFELVGIVLVFTLLAACLVQLRRDGTAHPVYRLVRDRASEIVSVHRICAQGLDLLYFTTTTATLQLDVRSVAAPTLLLAIQRVLAEQRRTSPRRGTLGMDG